jgi:pimeloyl-ACP methyl ester carboxylesterase
MAQALAREGYSVLNLRYASRKNNIERLGEIAIGSALAECRNGGAKTIHFVAHSLGAILVRSYLAQHSPADVGRVVMLGPPNRGSEVVDRLKHCWLFCFINGPAGQQLGTDADSIPNKLGPTKFCTGIIAGDRSINWINSLLIPGPDDGKVSVERSHLTGQADHIVVHATHPFMMRNRQVIHQTVEFLRKGRFKK